MRWLLIGGLAAITVGMAGLLAAGLLVYTLSPAATIERDPGTVMGPMMAGMAPAYVPEARARALGMQVPQNAIVDRSRNGLVFTTSDVNLVVLGSPEGGRDMTFTIAGLVNPAIVVPRNANITLHFINGDADTSHGWEVTSRGNGFSYMPMMDAQPAFSGAFAMPLGSTSSRGWPVETISFTANVAGTYEYICPVAGHPQRGMRGTFAVS